MNRNSANAIKLIIRGRGAVLETTHILDLYAGLASRDGEGGLLGCPVIADAEEDGDGPC